MLLYADHLQHWLDYGYGLLIILISVQFWFQTGQIVGSRILFGEPSTDHQNSELIRVGMLMYPDHQNSELIRFWLRSVDFPNCAILIQWTG